VKAFRAIGPLLAVAALAIAAGAAAQGGLAELGPYVKSSYDFGLPKWAPAPLEPKGNPTTPPKVELGRMLFYDTRLSRDGSISCASCHLQKLAFTDGRASSRGVTGQSTPRNSMSLANVGYVPALTWANPLLHSLEQQAMVPLVGQEPVEMGMAGMDDEVRRRIAAEPLYPPLFAKAFPEAPGQISLGTIARALSAFQRTIVSVRSPYDRYRYEGEVDAVSDAVIRGEALFFSERLECHHCHGGLHFADTVLHERNRVPEVAFHNTGLYNLDGKGAYPAESPGISDITGRPQDMGRFRAPSLRNIALTAPYMHDGSAGTLDDVLNHYAAGGRTIDTGPHAGVGSRNPLKSAFLSGFTLNAGERADLIAFLTSLTDENLLTDPRFADPWKAKRSSQP